MKTATLSDVLHLNDQLLALNRAGVPIDLGLPAASDSIPRAIERINVAVSRRVGQGLSVAAALDDDAVAPAAYRTLVQLHAQNTELGKSLTGAANAAATLDESWHALKNALYYPLILCCLAYVGMVGLCLFVVPRLVELQLTLQIPIGSGLRSLEALRTSLPYWVAIPPVVLLLAFVASRFRSAAHQDRFKLALLNRLPIARRAVRDQRCANFAEALARLLEAGVPFDDALATVPAPIDAGERGAAALPPFLHWAVWQAEGTVGRERALAMAASVYRESSQAQLERLRGGAPIVACIVLGGGVTLLYGIALFLPVVQLLESLTVASPT